jgi:hypothetical protein
MSMHAGISPYGVINRNSSERELGREGRRDGEEGYHMNGREKGGERERRVVSEKGPSKRWLVSVNVGACWCSKAASSYRRVQSTVVARGFRAEKKQVEIRAMGEGSGINGGRRNRMLVGNTQECLIGP